MSYYGAIHCGYCYEKGHNRVSCEKRKKEVEERRLVDPNSWTVQQYDAEKAARKVRCCKYCDEEGHNRRSCQSLKDDLKKAHSRCSEWRVSALKAMDELGLGIGSLVLHANEPVLVTGIRWDFGSHYAAVDMENTENFKELFAYTNWQTRPRTPMMLEVKRLKDNSWGQTEVAFPMHPVAAPFSDTKLLSAAPKSFTDSAPEDWVNDDPPYRVLEKFNPANW